MTLKTFIIRGTYGNVHIDPRTGAVILYEPDNGSTEYSDIQRFDVADYRQWLHMTTGRSMEEQQEDDILAFGFWSIDQDGSQQFSLPSDDHRNGTYQEGLQP